MFEEAVVDTIAITLQKNNSANNNVIIRSYLSSLNYNSINISQKSWIDAKGDTVNLMLDSKSSHIKLVIENNTQPLSSLCYLTVGMKPYQTGKGIPKQTAEDVKNRVFDAEYQHDKTYKKLLRGSDINQYTNSWNGLIRPS